MRSNMNYPEWLAGGFIATVIMVLCLFTLPLGREVIAQVGTLAPVQYLPIILQPQPTPTPPPPPVPIGPFGGTFTAIVVDAQQPTIVYAGSYTNGVYKSSDRGVTWHRMVNGLGNLSIQSLAIHPTNSNVVFVGTYNGGLYKTTNAAESWIKVGNSNFGNHIVYDIAIDRTNPNIVLITTRTKFSQTVDPLVGHLWRSADGGSTWQLLRLGNDFATPDYFYDVSIHPINGSRVFLSYHEHGFFRSDDGGFTFSAFNTGATDLTARSVAYDNMVNGLVYAGTWNSPSAYRSDNAGKNWVPIQPMNVINEVKTMKVVLVPFGSTYKQVLLATRDNGILSSIDRGSNWSRKGPGDIFINDIGVADSAYQYWFAAAQDLGIYRSVNAGVSWTNSRDDFTNVTITACVQSISRTDSILVSTIGQGVLSYDGTSWVELNSDLKEKLVTSLTRSGDEIFALTTEGLYRLNGEMWLPIVLPSSQVSPDTKYLEFVSQKTLLQEELLIEAAQKQSLTAESMAYPSYPIPLISFAEVNGKYFGGTAGFGLWCGDGTSWLPCGFVGESVTVLKPLSNGNGVGAVVCDSTNYCRVELFQNGSWTEISPSLPIGKINDFYEAPGSLWLATEKGLYMGRSAGVVEKVPQVTGEVFKITADENSACVSAAAGVGAVYTSTNCGSTWTRNVLGETIEEIKVVIADPMLTGQWFAGSLRSGVYKFSTEK